MAVTAVNQNGKNAAALRRDAHSPAVCGFGGGRGEVLWYFGYILPASTYLPQPLWQDTSLIFTSNRHQDWRKPANWKEKAAINIKQELFSKPISSNQDAWPAIRWMNTVPSLFRHLSEGNYHGSHPSTLTVHKWITKKGTKNLICELVCIPGIQGSQKIWDSCVTQN